MTLAWAAIAAIGLGAIPATLAIHPPRPIVPAAIERALTVAHASVFGVPPPRLRLRVAEVNVALETGRGRYMCHGNVGGIGARKGEPACLSHGHRVRRFRSALEGAKAYWRLRAVREALPFFDAGDARGAALALGAGGYYQASRASYADGMDALMREASR